MNRDETIELFTEFVKDGVPFCFTKFGDTELFCIDRKDGTGGEHYYSPAIAYDLVEAYKFLAPIAYLGNWKFNAQEIKERLELECGRPSNPVWYDCILFHDNAWLTKNLKEFYLAIRDSRAKKIYIGNEKIANEPAFREFLGIHAWYPTPTRDAYKAKRHILQFVDSQIRDGCIIMTSCSVMAKIIAHHALKRNRKVTFIDLGSALDPIFIGQTRARENDNHLLARKFFDVPAE